MADDVSDIQVVTPAKAANLSPTQLPIRGEKRLIPVSLDVNSLNDKLSAEYETYQPPDGSSLVSLQDFYIRLAKKTFTDYVQVRLPHRGVDEQGQPDRNVPAVFRFLVNPATVRATRQTVDAQAMTRAGWQFGVWGDDVVEISMQGQTAGQYFALGLTDVMEEFTLSYRNLQQLVAVYENNGYWFEGEEAGEGPLATDFTRRRIKMHEDVQLVVGNFIWYGMFSTCNISVDSEQPFVNTFNLSFIAWKERFRSSSPYFNSLQNDQQRGHSYGAFQAYGATQRVREALKNDLPDVMGGQQPYVPDVNPNLPEGVPPPFDAALAGSPSQVAADGEFSGVPFYPDPTTSGLF